MELRQQCLDFINNPFPLWETTLTQVLVKDKFQHLGIAPADYHTTSIWHGKPLVSSSRELIISIGQHQIYLEQPDFQHLEHFYYENGLELLNYEQADLSNIKNKLSRAFGLLNAVPHCGPGISPLVKAIQVLEQPGPEYDVSYSHPDIPFTIFVSVGEDDAETSALRLAESILHESMHLKLTLIEARLPIITEDSAVTFYSPWRNEERPLRGVLHGLFVFRAILDFYRSAVSFAGHAPLKEFIEFRIESIITEISMLKQFPLSTGLTIEGQLLTTRLLQD